MAVPLYASVTFADQYVADFYGGDPTWSQSTTPQKQAALVRATQWLDLRYGLVWRGRRTQTDQMADWPRWRAWSDKLGRYFESAEIPEALRRAAVEVALRVRRGVPLMPDSAVADRGIKRKKVSASGMDGTGVEKEIEYRGSANPSSTAVMFTTVEALIADLIEASARGSWQGEVVRG